MYILVRFIYVPFMYIKEVLNLYIVFIQESKIDFGNSKMSHTGKGTTKCLCFFKAIYLANCLSVSFKLR